MKKMLIFLASILLAYDAKVLPFDEFDIKASVSGEVIFADKNFEAENVNNKTIVKLDDYQEKVNKTNLKTQIKLLKNEIKKTKEALKRKEKTYLKYKDLKTKSQIEKDLKFYDYINTYNQLINLKLSLSSDMANLKKTEDLINKKNIKANGYVYEIYVNRGDYLTPGRLVAKVYDTSREKLYIYVPVDKINSIKTKRIYINNKLSSFKITKIWHVPDEKFVTSYKVELVGKGLKFGDIVDVEFKKE
ncbi:MULTISPECIES: hypothetical protein [unclassified Lebetimonas]|uniref:hypothetical protein n=1 Tax=unclassified Lebetimonas TaxID=2648158 RepID=UPI0004642566|nr:MULTISPECIES: hypothetical protein [unclassified Lebetimonas]